MNILISKYKNIIENRHEKAYLVIKIFAREVGTSCRGTRCHYNCF